MSFVDQNARVRPSSIAAVVAVHALVGYAIISGLAIRVVGYVPGVTTARLIPADPPPPPEIKAPPTTTRTVPTTTQFVPERIVTMPLQTSTIEVSQIPLPPVSPPEMLPPRADPPVRASLARGATIVGDRAAWVTTEDYPASALRANAEGTTAISVTIGIDGRVSACRVTATSGNGALDEAACRTYQRRARFKPALDGEGHAVAMERADRIRWLMPAQ